MTLERKDLEDREDRVLAPYAMHGSNSRGRVHGEPEDTFRTAFQRDRDRIVHSTAFRRLEYKTQVFVNHEGDYYRTRLTHTLEVAQIARSLARVLNLNEDLAEAASLGHDVGHTPFGHSGEDALRQMMDGHGGFEHNRHGLRVVDHLERRYPDFAGLNLSYEVREAMAKHATQYDSPVSLEFEPGRFATLEAQVVDLADSIAYNSHDVDDGIKSGLVNPEEFASTEIWRRAQEVALKRYGPLNGDMQAAQGVRFVISLQVEDAIRATSEAVASAGVGSVEDVRAARAGLACFSAEMRQMLAQLQALLFKKLYRHYRVVRMSEKAMRFLKDLFKQYLANPDQLPDFYRDRADQEDPYQVICDYIAGMTDRYAQDEYKRLFSPFEKT